MTDSYTPYTGGGQRDNSGGTLDHFEDAELRRLDWMARSGPLSERFRHQMNALRNRDRRRSIRQPTEFGRTATAAPKRSLWARLFGSRTTG